MLGVAGHGRLVDLADLAARVDQLKRVQQVAARVALVAAGVVVATARAGTLDKAIGQESVVDLAVGLRGDALIEPLVFPELQEDLLDNLGMEVGAGAAEVVEVDLEVVVDLLVQLVELIAQLAGCDALLEGLCLGRSAVLVGAADVERRVAALLGIAGEAVGRERRSDNVAELDCC